MNKKKKKRLRLLVVIMLFLVTLFTGSMVACGLLKGKNQDKNLEEEAGEAEEGVNVDETTPDLPGDTIAAQDEMSIDFDLDALPDTVEPQGLCAYGDALYVTDAFSKCVWKVTATGAEVFAGADSEKDAYDKPQGGYNDADAKESLFKLPWGVAPYGNGIAISDTDNGVVRIISDDRVDTVRNSDGEPGSYEFPTGITADENGNLFVSDTHAGSVITILPNGETTELLEELNCPMGLCYKDGFLYIAETGNNRILKVNVEDPTTKKASGDIQVIAGSGKEGNLDGETALSSFSSPKGVTVGNDGTVYVADTVNGAVRMIKDGLVATIAVKDARIPEAELVSPIGICIQGGRLYVADSFGGKIYVVE